MQLKTYYQKSESNIEEKSNLSLKKMYKGKNKLSKGLLTFFLCFIVYNCQNANKLALKGLEHLNAGRQMSAEANLQKALEVDKENALAHYGMGRIYLLGPSFSHSDGIKDLKFAIKKLKDTSKLISCYIYISDYYIKNKQYLEAKKLLQEANDRKLQSVKIKVNLAMSLIKLKSYADATRILKEAQSIEPNSELVAYNLGLVYASHLKKYKLALKAFEEANRLNKNQLPTLYGLMKVHYLLKNKKAALQYLNQIASFDKNNSQEKQFKSLRKKINKNKWKSSKKFN